MCSQHFKRSPKFASLVLICSQHCEKRETCITACDVFTIFHRFTTLWKRTQFFSTVLDAFTTLWKKEPNLHQHFWCVTTLSNKDRDLHHCFWRIHNIWKKAPNFHNRVCAHNSVNKDRNLHRCYLCVHNIVKKVTDDWWVHNIVKKDRNLHHCFWCVRNILKKTPKFASPVLVCSQHCEKRPKLLWRFLMSWDRCEKDLILHYGFSCVFNI